MIDLSAIREAQSRLAGRVHRTPLLSCRSLAESVGVSGVHLKAESLQKTGSFKPRGALNKVLTLTPEELSRGVITVSAGNHAQAVAWAAQTAGVPCAVVMPTDAPPSKLEAVRGYGAEAILHDDRATLFDRLHEEQEAGGSVFIHPFDDPVVLAGAGTVGLEIWEDLPQVDLCLVPVGGGGLMSGVTCALKALKPEVRVVAVELEAGPGLAPALEAGKPVPVSRPEGTWADGMTPPFVGEIPLQVARALVDRVVTVKEEELVTAMRFLMDRAKLVVEGSGAAATAALMHGHVDVAGAGNVVVLVSGGNLDLDRFAEEIGRP